MKQSFILGLAGLMLNLSSTLANPVYIMKNPGITGIFLKEQDFNEKNMNYKTGVNSKIRLRQFFFSSRILFKNGNIKKNISKDSIFAIQLKDGDYFRFFDQKLYKMEDAGKICIYSLMTHPYVYSISGPHRRIHHPTELRYYFSKTDQPRLHPLTRDNIERYMLSRVSDIQAFRLLFATEQQLSEKDISSGNLKINTFLGTL